MTKDMKNELEEYLHQHIPISVAMGIKVADASLAGVKLIAPFLNNINHKKTVFGGSLHAVATLACWSLLHLNLKDAHAADIVITNSNIDYLVPVHTDFAAYCILPEESTWKRFNTTLMHKGKARIKLKAQIFQNEKLAVNFTGTFAALKRLKIV